MKSFLLVSLAALALAQPCIAQEKPTAPDNSGKNERDAKGDTVTPGDQGNSPADLKITQDIRRAVMDDKSLTMTAKNVKIITIDGKVTLCGPVKTSEEKAAIVKIANTVVGQGGVVTDQIEIKTSN